MDDAGLQIAKLLSEPEKERERERDHDRWGAQRNREGKGREDEDTREKGRGTCCADRTSCEYVGTRPANFPSEMQDVSRHVAIQRLLNSHLTDRRLGMRARISIFAAEDQDSKMPLQFALEETIGK